MTRVLWHIFFVLCCQCDVTISASMHNSDEGVVQIVHILLLLEQKQHL
jgi:hypothetical protein